MDNVILELIYPILDVFQDAMHYTKDFTNYRSPLILKATWATNTVREDIIGVFIETDESHPKMKLIFEALFF